MPLEMKHYCESCGKRLCKRSEDVYICSYESTYCMACACLHDLHCPECTGTLQKRPSRIMKEIRAVPVEDVLGIWLNKELVFK